MSTAIITGGSAGIGFEIARTLGREGHRVVVAARDPERLERARTALAADGCDAVSWVLDVRDHEAVEALVAAHDDATLLVNNAAGNFTCPTVDLSPNGFRAVVEISLFGTFHCSTALARRLIARGAPGAIVNIVATYAWTGAPNVAHSAAAKAGVVAFTKSVAREWGPHDIRVNAVAPGFVATESAVRQILSSDDAQQRMRDRIPLGRFGRAPEIAESVRWLLSPAAAYVTGSVLTVDGGRSLGPGMHDLGDRDQALM